MLLYGSNIIYTVYNYINIICIELLSILNYGIDNYYILEFISLR